MTKITKLKAREIIDSRGNPTVEVEIELDNKHFGIAQVPSGASTGTHEACELRDGGDRYMGKGVLKAVQNVNSLLVDKLVLREFEGQEDLDKTMNEIDGTKNKSNLGANAILGISLSFAKALAFKKGLKLFEYFAEISRTTEAYHLPIPMMNILNGGKHADSSVDIQEFMIAPIGAKSFREALEMGVSVYHSLKNILHNLNMVTSVGDEGGFAPNLASNEDALKVIMSAIQESNYIAGEDIAICLDVAASELYKDGKYYFKGEEKTFTSDQIISYYQELVKKYPIIFIEDGLAEDDWESWEKLTSVLKDKVKTIGDDIYVTNVERLKKGIENNTSTSILIKLNQIGTVTETIQAINMAHKNHFDTIISHRSGETEDTTIADLSVGLKTGFIKTGAPCRTERVCKYNQLLRIEEFLGDRAIYGK